MTQGINRAKFCPIVSKQFKRMTKVQKRAMLIYRAYQKNFKNEPLFLSIFSVTDESNFSNISQSYFRIQVSYSYKIFQRSVASYVNLHQIKNIRIEKKNAISK